MTPPKRSTPNNNEEVDKDRQIAELKEQLDSTLQKSRILITTHLQGVADDVLKEKKQQLVNDAKKTVEKNQASSMNGAKKNLAKSFKES